MFPLSGLVGTFTSLASPTCLITLTPPPPTALLALLLLWMWGAYQPDVKGIKLCQLISKVQAFLTISVRMRMFLIEGIPMLQCPTPSREFLVISWHVGMRARAAR